MTRKWSFGACCGAAAVLVVAAYSNHFHGSFHFDDAHAIESNLNLRDLRNVPRFFTDARTFSSLPSNQSYRPLVSVTLAVDYRLGGLDTLAYHVDSFLLFLGQLAVMWALYRRVLGSRWAALVAAALYGVHAANAETVNYLIQRGDILSTLFCVVSVWLFARGQRRLSLVSSVCAVLSKEQGAMAAPLVFLYLVIIERRRLLQALREALPQVLVCAATTALSLRMAVNFSPGGTSRLRYLLTQPWVLLHYVKTFLLPLGLTADTDWTTVDGFADGRVLAGLAFIAAMLALALFAARAERTRPAAYGILWFFVALAPTSSLVPLAEVTNDHRLYFPMVGLCLAAVNAATLFWERVQRPRAAAALASCVLVAHAVGAHARNRVWQSEETLWRDVTEKSPRNTRGWMNWGLTRMAAAQWKDAERAFRKAVELAPGYGYAHVNLAILCGATGRPQEAEREFRLGLRFAPDVPGLQYYFARWLSENGRGAEALPLLQGALLRSPALAEARSLLLRLLFDQRRFAELAAAAEESLRIDERDGEARAFLARARAENPDDYDGLVALSSRLYAQGRGEEMLRACDRAVELRPASADAHNNRCAALNLLHRYGEAAAACEQALRLRPDDALARNNLAWARAAH